MKTNVVPFAWQDKRVLRLIRENCAEYHSALSVYVALTVVASDKESAEFQTTHQWIAMQSGLSVSTVKSRLKDLSQIGAVVVKPSTGLRQPSSYQLPPLANGCLTFGNGCRAIGNGEAPPLATSEEKKKRRTEHQKPRNVPERIAAENRLKILKSRFDELAADTSEQWQRDAYPEMVTEKQNLRAEITALENTLL